MAIYHLSAKIISRGKGQSAIGSAAYRRGAVLFDERTGTKHDYSDKEEVVHSEILIPDSSPAWIQTIAKLQTTEPDNSAQNLWNTVEAFEKRKDSELSREIEVALPIELTLEQNILLVRSFVSDQFCARGMVADFSVHWIENNPHVHIMLTTRALKKNGFGPKALQWRDKSLLRTWRQAWAEHVNRALAVEGYDVRIDHRSYAEQGIDLIPTKHEGPARYLHVKGIQTTRMQENENIRSQNLQMIAEVPELLIKKLGNAHHAFGVTQVVNGVASYVNAKETRALVSGKAWRGTRKEIEAVFNTVAKNEAVFQERALFSVLSKHTENAEAVVKALMQVKASSELLAIGPGEDGRERYTTRAVFDLENALQDLADKLLAKCTHQVKGHVILKILREYKLKNDQAVVLRHILSGKDIVAVVGLAGSGKTYSLKAANAAWVASGFKVHGVALSGVAADGMSDAGMNSRTIASFCEALKMGTLVLNKSDVVVMDEAGMTDSLNFFDVLLAVREAKAKVVLVGDPAQLQPIGFGAPFRALLERIGFAKLTTIRRQHESWQREASFKFAKGDIAGAIDAYYAKGFVKILQKAEEVLVSEWYQAIQRKEVTLEESLILAYRNVDVALLNQLARLQRVNQGELAVGSMVKAAKGDIPLAVGDRIMFLENNWRMGVRNGNRGTIIAMGLNSIGVRIDNGKTMEFNQKKYQNFDYGYACTVHKAQGVTIDKTFVLASGRWVSNLVYVAMTRHRHSTTLYANQDAYADIVLLKKALSRQEIKDSVLDYPLAFAARRGVDVESIVSKFQNHIKAKLKRITIRIKEQYEEIFNPIAYWERKKIAIEQEQKIQEILSRREDAKQVAAYIDANRKVGEAWEKVKINPQHFQETQFERNRIASELMLNTNLYAKLIQHYGISLEKIAKQSIAHQALWNKSQVLNKQKDMIAYATKLEQESVPIKGTLAEEYLREHRGIIGPIPDSFKFNIAVKEPETERYFPALIVVAKNKEGNTQAVQCVFLDMRTGNQAQIETPRRTYGSLKETSILVQEGTGKAALAESPETALSVSSADSTLTVYATLGISNMAKIPLPYTINKIILCPDNDRLLSVTDKVLMKTAESLCDRGFDVEVSQPQKIGQNFNNVLIEKGNAKFRKSAKPFEFKQKIEQYREIPNEQLLMKTKMNRELEIMADHIKNDPTLNESAKRYGVYSSVSNYASANQKTIANHAQSRAILSELKSKDPIQEFINISSQHKEIPAPWLQSTPTQKMEWNILNIRLNALGFAIDKDTVLTVLAIEKGIYQEIKAKSSNYYINLRDQQQRDRGIER